MCAQAGVLDKSLCGEGRTPKESSLDASSRDRKSLGPTVPDLSSFWQGKAAEDQLRTFLEK